MDKERLRAALKNVSNVVALPRPRHDRKTFPLGTTIASLIANEPSTAIADFIDNVAGAGCDDVAPPLFERTGLAYIGQTVVGLGMAHGKHRGRLVLILDSGARLFAEPAEAAEPGSQPDDVCIPESRRDVCLCHVGRWRMTPAGWRCRECGGFSE